MNKLLVSIATLILSIVGGGYLFFLAAFPHETIRYRLTLEAAVDGRTVTGSGVIQVTQYDTTAVFRNMGGAGTEDRGEAVVLDLGDRGSVFALLRGADLGLYSEGLPGALLLKAYRDAFGAETAPLNRVRILERDRPRREVPFDLLPMLVRFRNLSDRTSIDQVSPQNFAFSFGPGVVLRRATIEITDDPVTIG